MSIFILAFFAAVAHAADILLWVSPSNFIVGSGPIEDLCLDTQVHGETKNGSLFACRGGPSSSDIARVLSSVDRVFTPLANGSNALVGHGNTMLGSGASLAYAISSSDGTQSAGHVWTGCNVTGNTANNCNDFTTSNSATAEVGERNSLDSNWLDKANADAVCDAAEFPVYCYIVAAPTTSTPTSSTPTTTMPTTMPTASPTTPIPTTSTPTASPTTAQPTTSPTTATPTTTAPTPTTPLLTTEPTTAPSPSSEVSGATSLVPAAAAAAMAVFLIGVTSLTI